MKLTKYAAAVFAAAGMSLNANAITWYAFDVLVPNSASSAAVVESQIRMGVEAVAGGGVNFRFENSGPTASSLTDIYFQSAPPNLGASPTTTWSTGVAFSINNTASPGTPGGSIPWNGLQWKADSDSPVSAKGVNPTEWINFYFSGAVEANVLAGLNAGTWHTAIHVQSIGTSGRSEWAQTTTTNVPDGGSTLALVGLAMAGLGLARRKLS